MGETMLDTMTVACVAAAALVALLMTPEDARAEQGLPWAQAREMAQPKSVDARTWLVRNAEATAVIGAPRDPDLEAVAHDLSLAVRERTGIELPVVDAETLVEGPALAWADGVMHGGRNLILLGDLTSNPAIARLYMQWYAFEDRGFPGEGGHVVRTIVDPEGMGWNAVVLGGPDADGVWAAEEEFEGILYGEGVECFAEYCLSVTFGESRFLPRTLAIIEQARAWPEAWTDWLMLPSDAGFADRFGKSNPVDHLYEVFLRYLVYPGLHYAMTGEEEFARAAGDGVDAAYGLLDWVEASRRSSYDSHYQIEMTLRGWQQVANCPLLTDDQRARGHQVMAFLAGQMACYRGTGAATEYRILSRHQYSGVFSGDFLCRNAQVHCELAPELAQVIADNRADLRPVIEDMLGAYATGFDHKWGLDGSWHLLQAAAEDPQAEYVTGGMARLNADFATMCINNAGEFVNFGAENIGADELYDAWQILGRAATLTRDGRYQWWLDERMNRHPYKIFILSIGWQGHWYETALEPVFPEHMVGINRIALVEPLREDLALGRGRLHAGNPVVNDVPREECFSKITLRDGLERDDQYLMLDGLGGTTYSGNDANAICEYSRYGTPLLVQYTLKHEPFYQNVVSASRGNAGDPAGTFARVLGMADVGELLYTRTRLDPLTGLDHTRHLFMEKGGHVLVIDDARALVADEYSLCCTFRGFGEPELDVDAGAWTLRNARANLHLRSVPLPSMDAPSLATHTRVVSVNRAGRQTQVRLLRETTSRRFDAGENYRYANLFYGLPASDAPDRHAVALTDDAVAVRGDETVVYAAPMSDSAVVGPLTIEAEALRLARGSAQFIGCKRLALGDEALLDLAGPVTVSLDFGEKTCVIQSPDSECTGTIEWRPAWRVDATFADLARGVALPTGEVMRVSTTDLRHAVGDILASAEAMSRPERGLLRSPHPELPLTADELLAPGAEINANAWCDLDGDGREELICARDDGRLVAIGMDGATALDIATGDSPLLCVWTGELGGEQVVICGARDGQVRCYDTAGELRWEYRNRDWGYGGSPVVYSLAVGDFDGEGAAQLALGCHGGVTLMDVSAQPTVIRFTDVYSHVTDVMESLRLMGADRDWLALNTSGGGLKLVDPAAGVVVDSFAQFWGGTASHLAPYQFEGDDTWFVHAGFTGVGCGRLLREPWRAGKRAKAELWAEDAWYLRTDGEMRAVLVADLDADGTPEIITGNETGFLAAYDHRGQRLWKRLVGTPINDLVLADVTGDGREELLVAGDTPGLTAMTLAREVVGVWSLAGAVRRMIVKDGGITLLMRDGRVLRLP